MKRSEFVALCLSMLIDPALAMESEAVRLALLSRDRVAVVKALTKNF